MCEGCMEGYRMVGKCMKGDMEWLLGACVNSYKCL